mmetsp:Transcript_30351/g.100412  ORF Transcript_30351/g.100412 Transcript_30351/m.100412 type:complete len:81 (-) Transcript_30351:2-244(-)
MGYLEAEACGATSRKGHLFFLGLHLPLCCCWIDSASPSAVRGDLHSVVFVHECEHSGENFPAMQAERMQQPRVSLPFDFQ